MQRLILAVYQLLGTLLLPIIVIALILRSRNQPAYRHRIKERLGFCKKTTKPGGIIIHGASLGEITALKPFVLQALLEFPDKTIYVTSFTPAGSQKVFDLFDNSVEHMYLPFDSPICNWFFLNRTKPSVVVFMETELWPSLAHQIKSHGAELLLINARLSEKSVLNYQKIRPLIKSTLLQFNKISSQSEKNRRSFVELGASRETAIVGGNLKFDIAETNGIEKTAAIISRQLTNRIVWVIGSTHEVEEDIFLNAFEELKKSVPNLLLIIAPRHSERHAPIKDKLNTRLLNFQCRSDQNRSTEFNLDAEIWLIDTLGELLLFYAISDISTIAGSFDDTGGHNLLEPALFSKAITTGPNTKNNTDVTRLLIDAEAIIEHSDNSSATLAKDIYILIKNEKSRMALGQKANALLNEHRGATARNIQLLSSLLN